MHRLLPSCAGSSDSRRRLAHAGRLCFTSWMHGMQHTANTAPLPKPAADSHGSTIVEFLLQPRYRSHLAKVCRDVIDSPTVRARERHS